MDQPARSPAAPGDPAPEWTGARPLVSGGPVLAGLVLIAVAIVTMVVSLGRNPGLPAVLAAQYTNVMAGSLAADVQGADPAVLGRALARTGAPFVPRIVALDPEFRLLGGRAIDIDGRAGAAWLYRSPSSDFALGLAFPASLADVGTPDEAREDGGPALYIYRKTTQTIACWQDGPLVYALISTLPTETVIRLARRHAAPTPPIPAA